MSLPWGMWAVICDSGGMLGRGEGWCVPQPTDVVWGVLGEERGAAVCVFM